MLNPSVARTSRASIKRGRLDGAMDVSLIIGRRMIAARFAAAESENCRCRTYAIRCVAAGTGTSIVIAGQTRNALEQWIANLAPGRTFADVGGIGVKAKNERITLAVQSGAKSATMIDIRPPDFFEWEAFRKICAEKGVTNCREIASVDIN